MPSEGPLIPPTAAGVHLTDHARPRERSRRGDALLGAQVARRYFVDPNDIEGAIDRLTQLLAADINGPRMDAPRGFYLNILI